MYEVYMDRIDVEGISHYNALLEIYTGSSVPYTPEQKALYKERAITLLNRKTLKQLNIEEFEAW